MSRTGKIARLPREIRSQLNRRLRDGEKGRRLVEWLNTLPEVSAILHRDFNGHPVTEQNLYEWKQGGYPEWLAHQDAIDRIRVERDRDKTDQDAADYFLRWIEFPSILDCIRDPDATSETRDQKIRELLGMPPPKDR